MPRHFVSPSRQSTTLSAGNPHAVPAFVFRPTARPPAYVSNSHRGYRYPHESPELWAICIFFFISSLATRVIYFCCCCCFFFCCFIAALEQVCVSHTAYWRHFLIKVSIFSLDAFISLPPFRCKQMRCRCQCAYKAVCPRRYIFDCLSDWALMVLKAEKISQ